MATAGTRDDDYASADSNEHSKAQSQCPADARTEEPAPGGALSGAGTCSCAGGTARFAQDDVLADDADLVTPAGMHTVVEVR